MDDSYSVHKLYERIVQIKEAKEDGQSSQYQLFEFFEQTLGSVERVYFDYKTKADTRTPELGSDDMRNIAQAV